jgi:hypothetical protein
MIVVINGNSGDGRIRGIKAQEEQVSVTEESLNGLMKRRVEV